MSYDQPWSKHGWGYGRFDFMTKSVQRLWPQNFTAVYENPDSEKLQTLWPRQLYDQNNANATDAQLYDQRPSRYDRRYDRSQR